MKVADLEGAALDYWVAKASPGILNVKADGDVARILLPQEVHRGIGSQWFTFHPHDDWRDAGPIIERERIAIASLIDYVTGDRFWYANEKWPSQTPLIAAMRCFVASKFGEDVPDDLETKPALEDDLEGRN